MKTKVKTASDADDLRDDYSDVIRTGVRGKYAKRFASGTNLVPLAPDVAVAFPDADSVNSALRMLLQIARQAQVHS